MRLLASTIIRSVLVGAVLAAFGAGHAARAQQRPAADTSAPAADAGALQRLARAQAARAAATEARLRTLAPRLGLARPAQAEGAVVLTGVQGGRLRLEAPLNHDAARTAGADRLLPGGDLGLDLDGAGLTLGIWDGGLVRLTHREFGGRVTQRDTASALSGHGTHVAGTLAAAGVRAEARGLAPAATLDAYDLFGDDAEMIAAAPALVASNHSYGTFGGWLFNLLGDGRWVWLGDPDVDPHEDYIFGFYGEEARAWDAIAYAAPGYLIVKALGNDRGATAPAPGTEHWVFDDEAAGGEGDFVLSSAVRDANCAPNGYDCVLTKSSAKNVLTVGAVEPLLAPYTGPDDVVMSSFSGWGPTDDGRVKPDLVAAGVGLLSARAGSDAAYGTGTGTSHAAPVVTGAAALVQQFYGRLHDGARLRASTVKALLVHAAREAGPAPGPDYAFGWGLMDVGRAAALVFRDAGTRGDVRVTEATLAEGTTFEVPLDVSGTQPVHVTLAWTDPPGPASAPVLDDPTPRLVHDLDLTLVGPGDVVHRPWTLDPANPTAPATPGNNDRDNVEQVRIEAPVPGTYVVRVTHDGPLAGSDTQTQPFALVVGYLADDDTTLPVELTSFEARVGEERTPLLTWTTASETNNAGFAVERATAPAPDAPLGPFTEVAFVPAGGAPGAAQAYRYADVGLPYAAARAAYRLRQLDTDGTATLSERVTVRLDAPRQVMLRPVFPNPVRARATVQFALPEASGGATLALFNVLGRRVRTLASGRLPAGRHEATLDATGLASGVYFLRLRTPTATKTQRLVVVR